MKLKKVCLISILAILVILGCEKNINNENKTEYTGNNRTTNTNDGTFFEPDRIIGVTAEMYKFTPDTININTDINVRLRIISMDVTHGIAIPEYNLDERIIPGKPVNVDFTADEPGEYTYFCSVPCGLGHNRMTGKLIIG